jgi:hypothetical protein
LGVRILVIDDLRSVLGGRGDTRRELLNLLRFWATSGASRWPVPASGDAALRRGC